MSADLFERGAACAHCSEFVCYALSPGGAREVAMHVTLRHPGRSLAAVPAGRVGGGVGYSGGSDAAERRMTNAVALVAAGASIAQAARQARVSRSRLTVRVRAETAVTS